MWMMSENDIILAELRSIRTISELTAKHVDNIRTEQLPEIKSQLRVGEERMNSHGETIGDFKKWKDELTKEFWKLNGTFGLAMIVLMAVLHFVFK
jgi:hypothetical protein